MTVRIDRMKGVNVPNASVVIDGTRMVVCGDIRDAERIAHLIEREGWHDVDDMPADPCPEIEVVVPPWVWRVLVRVWGR